MRLLIRLGRLYVRGLILIIVGIRLRLLRVILIILIVIVRVATRAIHAPSGSVAHVRAPERSTRAPRHHRPIRTLLPTARKADTLLLAPTRLTPQMQLMQTISGATLARQLTILTDHLLPLAPPLLLQPVVVARRPARILLHVLQPRQPRLLIVLGLLRPLQLMPLAAQYLINGRRLSQRTLGHHGSPLLLHEQHERIQGLLHVRLLGLLLDHDLGHRRRQMLLLDVMILVQLAVAGVEGSGGRL